MTNIATIVLAGDRGPDDPLAVKAGVVGKVFVPVAGVPMIHHVIKALAKSSHVRDVTVVSNALPQLKSDPVIRDIGQVKNIRYKETSRTPVSSILDTLGEEYPYLVVTGDCPLLTAEMLDDFCSRALQASDADVVVGVVSKTTVLTKYPDAKRSFIRVKEDSYKGCNFFLLRTEKSRHVLEFWRGVEKNRKKGWRIIWAIGPWALFLMLIGKLDLDHMMKKASKALGGQIATVIMSNPDCAIDVDKPDDLLSVEAAFSSRKDPVRSALAP